MNQNIQPEEREGTGAVPFPEAQEEKRAAGETPRRRRSERYQAEREAEAAEEARPVRAPARGSETATAREVARRMGLRPEGDPLRERPQDPVRIPPRASGMSAASRLRMNAGVRTAPPAGRENIGYASGRMREGDARVRMAQEAERGGRQPQPGMPRRPVRPAEQNRIPEEPKEKRHILLKVLVALVLCVGLLIAAIQLIPEDAQGFPGQIRNTVKGWAAALTGTPLQGRNGNVISFTASGHENTIAPTDVIFAVTTSPSVKEVRLLGEGKTVLTTRQSYAQNAGQNVWNLVLSVPAEGYRGPVQLQIRTGEEWEDTNCQIDLSVGSLADPGTEATAAPFAETEDPALPDETEESDAESAGEPEGEPAEVFAEEPVGEMTQEPTEEPLAEFAEEPAEESTEEPTEEPADEFAEEFAEEPVDEFAEEPTEEPADEFAEEFAEEPADEFAEEPAEEPTDEFAEEPGEEPGEETAGEQEEDPAPTALTVKACEEADPSALIRETVVYNGTKKASDYNRPQKELISMPSGSDYMPAQLGVLTFRGDAFRQNAASGRVQGATSLKIEWQAEAGSVKGSGNTVYYGVGWVGQPAIVKWTREVREMMDLYESKKNRTALKEVIVAGMDGTIRFLDLLDGQPTRNSIKLGYPMRGTPSVHPGMAPYMNVGQYARKMARGTGKIGLRQYNLYSGKEMNLIDGLDGKNRRYSNAIGSFETSALMDRTSDTLITAGTNGLLYVINMGSTFDYKMGTYVQSPSPVLVKMKAKGETDADTAVEASVAMYDRYVFYADMGGILRCVDTNTMKAAWAVDTGDSVESTPALELEGTEGLRLYTANLLSKRKKGDAQIRCYDALSGKLIWQRDVPVEKNKKNNKETIGFRASPVVGQNALSGLVYYTVNGLSAEGAAGLGLPEGSGAALMALDKANGEVVWAVPLSGTNYSSPVAVYDESGNGWVIQCCGDGTVLLLDGLTGKQVASVSVESDIEASPAVYNDTLVIGTTKRGANYIVAIKIQ